MLDLLKKKLGGLLAPLDGMKTYLAGVGLLGLALYQASQGDYSGASQSALAGLAALGLRHAMSKATQE